MGTDDLRMMYNSCVHFNCKDGDEAFSDDYVLWLEAKLINTLYQQEHNLKSNPERISITNIITIRLKGLQRWRPEAGCYYGDPSIDWEEDIEGDWIDFQDIEKIIKDLDKTKINYDFN